MNPRVFVISGPSGVGKSSIIQRALAANPLLHLSISSTTRGKRRGERDGVDYNFISRAEFEKLMNDGEFLEFANVFDNYYGTSHLMVKSILGSGDHALLDVDIQGAMNIKTVCSGVVFIFIKPPSLAQLEVRLRKRGTEDDANMMKRLAKAEHEISFAGEYDYQVINDELEKAATEVIEIIEQEQKKDVPFVYPVQIETTLDEGDGDDSFLEHLSSTLKEKIIDNFTDQVRLTLKSELMEMINTRLQNVLENELENLILDQLRSVNRETG